ncbi:putative envelope-like protein, partial [Trifolium pratense]
KKKQSLKRKEESSSDSKYDVEEDVPEITPSASKKKSDGKKIPQNVLVDLCDNVSFHRASFAQRWDHVYKGSFC